ncbi:hypothetical protein [Georgenia sunbinii]|uniref:hypothetical protein n=1 Tax=Georgenia sunbinii TaxID=3117728 RepID=UPI002F25FFFC
MELASYLAGERWSDRPACTHPLLAHLARLVNDLTDDQDRPRLAVLIPSVIGLSSTDPHWDDELTLLAASRAIPVVSEHHQRALAVGVLACERSRAARAGSSQIELHPASRRAFEQAPLAAAWAREFVDAVHRVRPGDGGHPGDTIVEIATVGLARACITDPAGELRRLLTDAITICEHLAQREAAATPALAPESWQEVCRPAPVAT